MIDIYKVYSRDVNMNNAQFHLWVARSRPSPSDATETYRLAVLDIFFGHAKIEMLGFGWRLLGRSGRPAMVEERCDDKDGNGVKWIVDAPRLEKSLHRKRICSFTPLVRMLSRKHRLANWQKRDVANKVFNFVGSTQVV